MSLEDLVDPTVREADERPDLSRRHALPRGLSDDRVTFSASAFDLRRVAAPGFDQPAFDASHCQVSLTSARRLGTVDWSISAPARLQPPGAWRRVKESSPRREGKPNPRCLESEEDRR